MIGNEKNFSENYSQHCKRSEHGESRGTFNQAEVSMTKGHFSQSKGREGGLSHAPYTPILPIPEQNPDVPQLGKFDNSKKPQTSLIFLCSSETIQTALVCST